MGKKGFYVSKGAAAAAVIVVVVLLVAEGLLVGLLGRPTCSSSDVPEPPTSTPTKAPITSTLPPVETTTGPPEVWQNDRLPLNLAPSMYKVWLKPVLEIDPTTGLYIFYGSSSVQYTCQNSTDLVILHSIDLNYTDPLISNFKIQHVDDGAEQVLADAMFYQRNEYLVLRTEAPCVQGHEYNLTVGAFQGELGDDLDGLYRSEYVNEYGVNRVIATTQMEVAGARRTFPCFDEPSFKAIFEITLLYRSDQNYSAISNMLPALNDTVTDANGVVWNSTTFELTPLMSTYLLAMIVSDFDYEDGCTDDGIQTRIYARPVPIRNGEAVYTAEVTPKVLKVIEGHYNVAYPLAKSDQVAVPDFGAGAMENWGLVIYREVYLLFDEAVTSVYSKYSIVQVIAHELAHQWFGNLVTTHWWSDIWLNEGFASYVQFIGVEGVRPSWKVDELFVIEDLQGALAADDSSGSHPLHHPQGYFSTITYSKGASFLRMVNDFMGEETFTNAITNYLIGNEYDIATYQILFDYWAAEAKKDNLALPEGVSLDDILEPWVVQMGYPLLNITSDGTNFIVTQEYFLIDPDDTPRETPGSEIYNYKWYVPFTYKLASTAGTSDKVYFWMHPDDPINIPINGEDYILANIDAVGFYRVNYDLTTWGLISEKLKTSERSDFSPQNRAQLIDDVFAITRSGKRSVEVAMELSSYLGNELDYIVWDTFVSTMVYFDRMLTSSDIYGDFSAFISEMVVSSIYNEFGWDDTNTTEEAQIERMTRGLAVDTACYYGYDDCIETAKNLYQAWMNDPDNNTIISSTYRSDVYCTAIRAGGVEEWDFAWSKYLSVDSAQEQSSLRYGMSCSLDPWIINRYIEYALDNVRNQDMSSTLSYIASHEHSKYIAWSFARNNWDLMIQKAGSGATNSMLNSAKRRFSTEYDLDLIDSLRETAGPGWTATLNSYYNEVVDNLQWRLNNEDKIRAWLGENPILETLTRISLKHKKIDGAEKVKEDKKAFHKRF